MAPAHRCNRVEIDVEVGSVERGRQMHERLSVLHRERLARLIERVCTELSGPDRLDRIDTLELDLGRIEADGFEADFIERLEAELRASLAGALRDGRRQTPAWQASRELIECFARTGNLPWWADRSRPDLLATHLQQLLGPHPAPNPAAWQALLVQLADDPAALHRLARHLDGGLFEQVLQQAGGAALQQVVADLERVLRRLGPAPPGSGACQPRLARPGGGNSAPLPEVVLAAWLDDLAEPVRAAVLLAVWLAEAESEPDSFKPDRIAALGLSREPTRPARNAELQRAVSELAPLLRRLGQAGARASQRPAWRAEVLAALAPQAGAAAVPLPEAVLAQPLPPARRRPMSLDEIHVEEAGLVLLWPFLEHFFARLGLLAERRFVSEPAQQQAVALLAHVLFAEPEPPEYALPLVKLLCGLAPEAPLATELPLADEALQECERLLVAVIEHAPVLREMPVPAFRAAFLLRSGVLSVRAGAWLLQVEQQSHDLVLERFSWSWAWVKLPWMDGPLQVEW